MCVCVCVCVYVYTAYPLAEATDFFGVAEGVLCRTLPQRMRRCLGHIHTHIYMCVCVCVYIQLTRLQRPPIFWASQSTYFAAASEKVPSRQASPNSWPLSMRPTR